MILLIVAIVIILLLLAGFVIYYSLNAQKARHEKTLRKLEKAKKEQNIAEQKRLEEKAAKELQAIEAAAKKKEMELQRKTEQAERKAEAAAKVEAEKAQEAERKALQAEREAQEAVKKAQAAAKAEVEAAKKKAKAEAEAARKAKEKAQAEAAEKARQLEIEKRKAEEARRKAEKIRFDQARKLNDFLSREIVPNFNTIINRIKDYDNLREIEIAALARALEDRGDNLHKLESIKRVKDRVYDIHWAPVDKKTRKEKKHISCRYRISQNTNNIVHIGLGVENMPGPTDAATSEELFNVFQDQLEEDGYKIFRNIKNNIVDENTVDYYLAFTKVKNVDKTRYQTHRANFDYKDGKLILVNYGEAGTGTTARAERDASELTQKHKCGGKKLTSLALRKYNETYPHLQARNIINTNAADDKSCDMLFDVYKDNTNIFMKKESRRFIYTWKHEWANPTMKKMLGENSGKTTPIPKKTVNSTSVEPGVYFFKVNDRYFGNWSMGLRTTENQGNAIPWEIKKTGDAYWLLFTAAGSKKYVFTGSDLSIGRTYASNRNKDTSKWKFIEKNGKYALYNVGKQQYFTTKTRGLKITGQNPEYVFTLESRKSLQEVKDANKVGISLDLDGTEPHVFSSGRYLFKMYSYVLCEDLKNPGYTSNTGNAPYKESCIIDLTLMNSKSQLYTIQFGDKYLINNYGSLQLGSANPNSNWHIWQIVKNKDGDLALRNAMKYTGSYYWLSGITMPKKLDKKYRISRLFKYQLYPYTV